MLSEIIKNDGLKSPANALLPNNFYYNVCAGVQFRSSLKPLSRVPVITLDLKEFNDENGI